jgi:hypothetical protein
MRWSLCDRSHSYGSYPMCSGGFRLVKMEGPNQKKKMLRG